LRRVVVILGLLSICFAYPALAAKSSDGKPRYPSLKIAGFGDFEYGATDDDAADVDSTFQQGQFVLQFVSALSVQWSFFAELTLSATDDNFESDLERGFIKYDHNDHFKIAFGRFHTPISWWNTAFHHGAWLQTTITRPEVTRFGGEFVPVHYVGTIAEGSIPSGSANLGYLAGVGNGRHENIARPGDAGDINSERAIVARLNSRPDGLFGLEAGIAYYGDKITLESGDEYDERIGNVFVVYSRETPEVIAEYHYLERENIATRESFSSDGFYAQFAYRLPVWKDRLKPYARYERVDVDDAEPVFASQDDRDGYTVGLRLDVSTFVAVKVEYRRQRSNQDPYINAGIAQVSWAF
jgi:hypothetical protein